MCGNALHRDESLDPAFLPGIRSGLDFVSVNIGYVGGVGLLFRGLVTGKDTNKRSTPVVFVKSTLWCGGSRFKGEWIYQRGEFEKAIGARR